MPAGKGKRRKGDGRRGKGHKQKRPRPDGSRDGEWMEVFISNQRRANSNLRP